MTSVTFSSNTSNFEKIIKILRKIRIKKRIKSDYLLKSKKSKKTKNKIKPRKNPKKSFFLNHEKLHICIFKVLCCDSPSSFEDEYLYGLDYNIILRTTQSNGDLLQKSGDKLNIYMVCVENILYMCSY